VCETKVILILSGKEYLSAGNGGYIFIFTFFIKTKCCKKKHTKKAFDQDLHLSINSTIPSNVI